MMRNLKPFVRLALRRMARKNPSRRDDIRTILRDGDLLDALIEEVQVEATSELGAIGDGTLLDFFKWIIENADVIFDIITKLLVIFAAEVE